MNGGAGCHAPGARRPAPDSGDVVTNPPGLAQIGYRAGGFGDFRQALLRPLAGEQAIGDWRPAAGDLGLQVLEWWAYLADVLTFYNERIANESYLRTATRAESVAGLVGLLGYAPAPGLAATGVVAALRKAGHPTEPLAVPAGMRLSSVATPGIASQTFEVDEAVTFSGPSTVPVTLPPNPALLLNFNGSPQSVLLAGRVNGIQSGDELLLVERGFAGSNDHWSLVSVGAVTPTPDPASGAPNTLVTFSAGTWGPSPLAVPAWWQPWVEVFEAGPGRAPQAANYRLLRATTTAPLWNHSPTGSAGQTPPGTVPVGQKLVIEWTPPTLTVHLAAALRTINPGDLVLLTNGAGSALGLGTVAGTSESLWTVSSPLAATAATAIVIAHTALALNVGLADLVVLWLGGADPTTVSVRSAFKDVGTVIGLPAPSLDALPVTVEVPTGFTPEAASTAILEDATGAGTLVSVTGAGPGHVTLAGSGDPPAALPAPLAVPLQLLPDVVAVSRGTTVAGEVLGSGNAVLVNQSFTLAKSPLTYLASGAGWASTLSVYVDGIEWQEVASFYGQARDARVYVVTRSADQTVTAVTFGDGTNGARLPTGSGNVVANYRYGSGAASPPAGRLTTIAQPQPNLGSIQNPIGVSGGVDPQTPEGIRLDAPASVATFGRAISASDYELVASRAPGVHRAAASWSFDPVRQRTLVSLWVGDDEAAVAAARAALAGAEDPNRPVLVVPAVRIALALSARLLVAPDRLVAPVVTQAVAAVGNAAGGLFSPARMGIGQRLYRSAVSAALSVPGVVAVHDLEITGTPAPFDEVADPGAGVFFDLPPAAVSIVGVIAGG
jgi:hypothetical protein